METSANAQAGFHSIPLAYNEPPSRAERNMKPRGQLSCLGAILSIQNTSGCVLPSEAEICTMTVANHYAVRILTNLDMRVALET